MAANYYESVVEATEDYLGPAAERFVRRQIDFHLSKPPESIDKKDVLKLRDSLCVALGLLVDDKKMIDEAGRKFDAIVAK
ncbi:MAG TPA: hypothetical protein VNG90_04570 [Candidatus Acidoferrum sp.]|nr:hypothetical protein [Candidatus Acidoferrum sp.]